MTDQWLVLGISGFHHAVSPLCGGQAGPPAPVAEVD